MKKQLNPGAKWSFRIGGYFVMLFLSFFLGWFMAPISMLMEENKVFY